MLRFMDKIELTTVTAIQDAASAAEFEDIFNYVKNHSLLTTNSILTFFKNPNTPEHILQYLIERYCPNLEELDNHAILFLAANPNTPTPVLERIAELPISDQVKQYLLDNPGTPYSVKEALDNTTYQNYGFHL